MPHDFYKHMPREDNSTVFTGRVSVRVQPNADVYAVAEALASGCRIPERPVLQPWHDQEKNPDVQGRMKNRGREVTFNLVWQRVDNDVEIMRKNLTAVLLRLGPNIINEIIEINVMTPEQVKARESEIAELAEHRKLPAPLRVA